MLLNAIWWDESGQDLVEYTLLIVFIALALVAALELLSGDISSGMNRTGDMLDGQIDG